MVRQALIDKHGKNPNFTVDFLIDLSGSKDRPVSWARPHVPRVENFTRMAPSLVDQSWYRFAWGSRRSLSDESITLTSDLSATIRICSRFGCRKALPRWKLKNVVACEMGCIFSDCVGFSWNQLPFDVGDLGNQPASWFF